MNLQKKLHLSYTNELKLVKRFKENGISKLESSVWDFSGEHEDDSLIPIDEVILELEKRISILSTQCTDETINELNY